jgi:copper resistance protein B
MNQGKAMFWHLRMVAMLLSLLAVPEAAAQQRPFPLPPAEWPETIHDNSIRFFFLADRLEYQWSDEGPNRYLWDLQGWIGGDWNRFWYKVEGENLVGGETEKSQVEALYARLIAPFWHLQAGLRHDFRPRPERTYLALGVQGLGLFWFELEATAYLSEEGDLSARLETEYDLLITQRLVLQPRLETSFSATEVEELGVGRGFNEIELGLRLRYEIRREFAPYAGVTWTRLLGDTADLVAAQGEDKRRTAWLAGLRLWY